MDIDQLQEIRERYWPAPIRVLFVGESPPAGGTFFYRGDSNLARYTRAAFSNVYGEEFETGESFLRFFQSLGCYLDDLCLDPVNHLSKSERKRARSRHVPGLGVRLREIAPEAIVVVMKEISPHVQLAASQAGLTDVVYYSLPFPALGNQHRYTSKLVGVLRELKDADILPNEEGLVGRLRIGEVG
jgi:hypothetical protein